MPVARCTHLGTCLWVVGGRHLVVECNPATVLPGHGDAMSDFLTRLAERTLGRGAVVRPIYTPMFAPVAAPPAAPHETTWGAVSQELTESEPSPTSARPRARRPAHPPSPAEDSFAHAEAFSPALTSHPPLWQRGERGDLPASEDR